MEKDKITKTAENASLGEYRCSALLAERFWVLSRNVDLDGADFLIQLSDPGIRFTDPLPPRLGIVQSKFSQDKNTVHYIPSKYVVDGKTNEPYEGYFLLVHTGRGSDRKRYLLTSEQMVSKLKITKDDSFCVGAFAYSVEFESNDDEKTLDVIEKVLRNRSDEDAKRFLHAVNIPEYPLKRANVESKWLAPIPNEHLFIPDEIYKIKHGLKMVLDSMAASFEDIGDALMERDVEECMKLLEKIKDDSSVVEDVNGFMFDKIGPFNLGGALLCKAIEIHKKRYELLLSDKEKSQCYIELQEKLEGICWREFEKLSPKTKSVPGGLKYVPYTCTLSFDVSEKNCSTGNIILSIDSNKTIPEKKNRVVITREIFTSSDGSKLEAVRDMHQAMHLALAEYFKIIFPAEKIGDVKLPMLLME
ncbi:hypothetical protein [Undibacterium curvum]|uniref:DUF4365 domain-containing protein n=1 Tax=Undibacterium curvum TaxID=2762294 RepID=A0ABR7A210_9BURK|nr:hypothetical protein [Undibacterium curvum]MBC3930717.1 hypothetical protein [Undibacterium curvum]